MAADGGQARRAGREPGGSKPGVGMGGQGSQGDEMCEQEELRGFTKHQVYKSVKT